MDLLNHLVEVVEPRLQGDEVEIDPVEEGGRHLLLLRVESPRQRGPFAQLREGGRHFMIRVDHRIRPMTREEIFPPREASEPQTTTEPLTERRRDVLRRDKPGLWVGVHTVPQLRIDAQSKVLEGFLLDPGKSGNRLDGWNFRYPPMLGVRPLPGAERIDFGQDHYRKTTVWENGCIEFWTTLEGLHHRTDSVQEIYPLALLEYPVSIMRLAAGVYDSFGTPKPRYVYADIALTRATGWHLPIYAPKPYEASPQTLDDGEFLPPSPLMFSWKEFREHPDHAGYMLVRSVYQAFHLSEDRIPDRYDRKNRRLAL